MEIVTLQRRLVEVGRIRLGEKRTTANGKSYPARLTKFRLTSRDKARLDAAAALYGGEVKPWEGAWELYTDTDVLPVAVVPGQAISQSFELWGQKEKNGRKSGVICLRRCDGETEHLTGASCLCDAEDERRCKPTTRLSVMLTEVPGIGVWRVEAHGWNAAAELVGGVQLLEALMASGRPVPARLRLDFRTQTTEDETRQFVVPVLDIDQTIGQVLDSIGPARPTVAVGTGAASFQPVPAALPSAPVGSIAEQVAATPPTRRSSSPPMPATGVTPGPVCAVCGVAFTPTDNVKIVQGVGRAHKDGCPSAPEGGGDEPPASDKATPPLAHGSSTDGDAGVHEPPANPPPNDDARRFAIDCNAAFKAAYDEAPRGEKTKRVDRLRHALVWALTGWACPDTPRTVHYAEACENCQVQAHAHIGDIIRGAVTYEYTDTAAVFTFDGRDVVVPWSEIEGG